MRNVIRIIPFFLVLCAGLVSGSCSKTYFELSKYVRSVRASTPELASVYSRFNYNPRNLLDGNLETCWQESISGPGLGEWVEFRFSVPVDITLIKIGNGFQYDDDQLGDLFQLNNRVKRLRICADDADCNDYLLADEKGWQEFSVKIDHASVVRMTILETYIGNKWNDTAIADVMFFGSQLPKQNNHYGF